MAASMSETTRPPRRARRGPVIPLPNVTEHASPGRELYDANAVDRETSSSNLQPKRW